MLTYRICALADLGRVAADFSATHVVSLIDPGMDAPATPAPARGRHAVLRMHDLDRVDRMAGDPAPHHVATLLDLARDFRPVDRPVFHCIAGRRRSTAAALLCDIALRLSRGDAPGADLVDAALRDLRAVRPSADPNRALVGLADDRLGLGGALIAACATRMIDLGDPADAGPPS